MPQERRARVLIGDDDVGGAEEIDRTQRQQPRVTRTCSYKRHRVRGLGRGPHRRPVLSSSVMPIVTLLSCAGTNQCAGTLGEQLGRQPAPDPLRVGCRPGSRPV